MFYIIQGGGGLTNINCSTECIHQKDGKCGLERVVLSSVIGENQSGCIYYQKTESATNKDSV